MFRDRSTAIILVLTIWGFGFLGGDLLGDEPGRVTHYALVSTGPSINAPLEPLYWGVNETAYRVLRNHGYPHEAIFCLSEHGRQDSRRVDGKSTLENFRATCRHLAKITSPDDHVTIMLVGHGKPWNGDFFTPFIGGVLTATEFGELVEAIPAKNMTLVVHPCYSGGFLPRVSGDGRVVVTSTNDSELNAVPWAEAFLEAFTPGSGKDLNADGRVSILEAYVASLQPGREAYGNDLREHPLLDDNGDGVGHFGSTFDQGDGEMAKARFLGNAGAPLRFSRQAIDKLRQANAELRLE